MDMNRLIIIMVSLAASLFIGPTSNAATVDIYLNQTSQNTWTVTVDVIVGVNLGSVGFITSGNVNSIAVNASIPTIDSDFSVLSINPNNDGRNAIIIDHTANGAVIAAGGTSQTLLASLGTTGGVIEGYLGDEFFGSTALAANGDVIPSVSITVRPASGVPTASTVGFFALGGSLMALGIIRLSRRTA